jgi:Transcription termination factor nusG
MANEHWYVLKVRPDFVPVVTQKLRELSLNILLTDEVIFPDPTSTNFRETASEREHAPASYVYCRFDLEQRLMVTSVPGVLDILGIPKPTAIDSRITGHQTKRRFNS